MLIKGWLAVLVITVATIPRFLVFSGKWGESIPKVLLRWHLKSEILQTMEAAQVYMNRWMDKEELVCSHTHTHTHTHTMEYYSAITKKPWSLTIGNNMDRSREYNAKWNKPVRKTNTIWFHSCVEVKKQNEWV